MTGLSVSISCPSCGGALKVSEGEKTLNCGYCDSLLFIEGDAGFQTIMLQNMLTPDTARALAQQWFSKGLKARNLRREAKITECYPIYAPYWRLIARAAGWVCGYREETRIERDARGNIRTRTERIPMEKMVFQDFTWSSIACDIGDLGIKSLRNFGGNVLLHEDGSIPTFEPSSSKTDAFEKAKEEIRCMAIRSANVPHITFQKMHIIPRYFGLVYYPVWIVRYKYHERMYFVTFDGVTGQSLSGRAPGDPLYRSMIMTGGAAAGILSGLGLGLIFSHLKNIEIALGIFIAGAAIFGGAYMFFRHGSEIVEGDLEASYKLRLARR